MLLGIVLHTSNIFALNMHWAIENEQKSFFYTVLTGFIHQFRMPAFFIVSGFFCRLTLHKYGAAKFLRVRMRRLLLPMLVVALSLNTIQAYFLYRLKGVGGDSFVRFISGPAFWLDGVWVSHLWFLGILTFYFLCAALLCSTVQKLLQRVEVGVKKLMHLSPGGFRYVMLPTFTFLSFPLIYVANGVMPEGFAYRDGVSNFLYYSSFFMFGVFLGANMGFLERFSKVGWETFAIAIGGYWCVVEYSRFAHAGMPKMALFYVEQLEIWAFCIICFYLFRTFANRASALFAYMSEASYSIYLFHHIFVVLIGAFVVGLPIPIHVKFILVLVGASMSAFLLHHYGVLRFKILRLLFNGK